MTERTKSEREKLFEFTKKFYKDAFEIMQKKNADYSQEDNPYSNFEFTADASGVKVEQVFLMQIADKMARMRECFDKPLVVLDESLIDTLRDTINFCALCASYINEKNLKKT